MSSSQGHAQLGKKQGRRRICSAEEDQQIEMQYSCPSETVNTPSGSSQQVISNGSSGPGSSPGTVINMRYKDDTPWVSAEEDGSLDSDTSTPDCKRGRHQQYKQRETLHEQAIREVAERGVQYPLPSWTRGRAPAVHILADAKVAAWPTSDNICTLDYKPGWKLRDWIGAIRAENVRISQPTVILYLEVVLTFEDVPPLKNSLHMLCKVIRQHQLGARIFLANLLPRISSSPLSKPIVEHNYQLLQAVHSTGRAIHKVFYLSIYEHFVSSRKSRVIKPVSKYFADNDQLTYFGCLMLRECLLRKAGLKQYWFGDRSTEADTDK